MRKRKFKVRFYTDEWIEADGAGEAFHQAQQMMGRSRSFHISGCLDEEGYSELDIHFHNCGDSPPVEPEKETGSFLLFGGDLYYPGGGWSDYYGTYRTLEGAIAKVVDGGFDWWHVVDLNTGSIVQAGAKSFR